jgi:hypothetical protein
MKSNIMTSKNPIHFSNKKTEALEEAYKLIIEVLNEYADSKNLSESEFSLIKEQILTAFLERKASLFWEYKLGHISENFKKAISFALTKSLQDDDKDSFTKLFYYRDKHRLVKNE